MASIEELKRQIDLHDLAERLGLERPQAGGNYRSPTHNDSNPSLSIYQAKDGSQRWKDWSTDRGGTCIDLVCYVEQCDVAEAIRRLHEIYGLPVDAPRTPQPVRPQTLAEKIAESCLAQAESARAYLKGRGITDAVIDRAIQAKAIGWNTWTSPKVEPGGFGHGGPALATIVRSENTGLVVAVDMRYADPALNGGVKTQTQGEKQGSPWTMDWRRLRKAQTVVVVESAINAMSIDCCELPGTATLAIRGTANVGNIDWHILAGKRVIICMDNDDPANNPHGRSPGREAAWQLHEALTALNVAALMVCQDDWEEKDVNDILQEHGVDTLKTRIRALEDWLIPGLPGKADLQRGRSRVFLPPHDFAAYWRFRVKEDFTTFVSEVTDQDGEKSLKTENLAGFRVAAVSRIQIAGVTSMMTGDQDTQPQSIYAVAVQAPRYGHEIQRRVFKDEDLFNVDYWRKVAGPIYKPAQFLRMVNILERAVHLGERKAVNFVGLAWSQGQLVVNEGPDCYFSHPEQQCPYHGLTFPSGPSTDSRRVIDAYQKTFRKNAAAQLLAWSLGGHLKAFLGFWPHMFIEADKGAGKSTLIKALERSISFTMYSGQSLQTEYRLLTSISHTSHPVGWEEISARRQDIIDRAVSLLQEAYNYTVTRRGSEQTQYVISAPVLLAGEDVQDRAKSLLGKAVRVVLSDRKGDMIPDDLPRFPVRQWLQYLATFTRAQIRDLYQKTYDSCLQACMAAKSDDSARRMTGNYAAVLLAWRLLCDFAEIPTSSGRFVDDLIEEMNTHIGESEAMREPWVWIMETLVSEIDSGNYRHPYTWKDVDHEKCLVIRTSNIMDHLSQTMALRAKWDGLPIKSATVLQRQMRRAGVIVDERVDFQAKGKRYYHMTAISLKALARYGIHATPDEPPPDVGWEHRD